MFSCLGANVCPTPAWPLHGAIPFEYSTDQTINPFRQEGHINPTNVRRRRASPASKTTMSRRTDRQSQNESYKSGNANRGLTSSPKFSAHMSRSARARLSIPASIKKQQKKAPFVEESLPDSSRSSPRPSTPFSLDNAQNEIDSYECTDPYERRDRALQDSQRLAISIMSLRVVQRVQLINNFVELYLGWDKIARCQHSDLAALPSIEFNTPLLQAVADTICFVGLGAAHQDGRLVHESRIRYGCALRLLAAELQRKRPSKQNFHQVVTAIMLLRFCELFDALSYIDGGAQVTAMGTRGWNHHLKAVQHYMRACGPKDLLQTDGDWRLFQTVRHTSFYSDLFDQGPSMFAEPEWLEVTVERAQAYPAVALYNLRAQFPGLLARVRDICARWVQSPKADGSYDGSGIQAQMQALVRDSDQLQIDLQWLRDTLGDWMAQSGEMVEAGSSQAAMSAAATTIPKDPTTVLKPSRWHMLRTSYTYSSPEKAAQCTSCWMLCISIDEALSTLLSTRISALSAAAAASHSPSRAATSSSSSPSPASSAPTPVSNETKTPSATTANLIATRTTVDRDAYVCATNLARSIDYCCQPSVARVPTVAAFHLRVARDYFARAGHTRWESWCVGMSRVLEVRAAEGLPVDSMAPKICRRIVSQQFLSLGKTP